MDLDLYVIAQRLLQQSGWSDLHFHVGQPPRVRNAGMQLVPVHDEVVTEDIFAAFAARVTRFGEQWRDDLERAAGNLDCSATLYGLDGGSPQRFRANFLWHGAGGRLSGLVMRRINESIPPLESLGLPPAALALGERASGLLLFTGVTGSGKSTSMAAMIARIASAASAGGQNIVTLEDPVEYLFSTRWPSQVLQREVGAGKDCPTFAAGLRAALREDPDVIMVGEIRDAETAELALTAAQTGHLVLSTLHTRSAVHTVDRLVAMFPADAREDVRSQLAGCLLGVVSQMLLPAIGGGRVLAAELMVGTPAIAAHIRDAKSNQIANTMRNERRTHGSMLLNEALFDLIQARRIERDVALAVAYDQVGLRDLLGGGR